MINRINEKIKVMSTNEIDFLKKEMISKVDKEKLSKLLCVFSNILFKGSNKFDIIYNNGDDDDDEDYEDRERGYDLDVVNTDIYLTRWAENKINFYLLFDRNLSMVRNNGTGAIDYSITIRQLIEKIQKQIDLLSEECIYNLEWFFKSFLIDSERLSCHEIEHLSFKSNSADEIIKLIDNESIYVLGDWIKNNKINYDLNFRNSNLNYLKNFHLAKNGVKFSKFLSKICKDKQLDILISNVIYDVKNQKKDNSLVLSIDPCDFLMASTNKHNWSSCLSLNNSYGQKVSTLAYMLDNYSIIQYMANLNKEYSYNFLEGTIFNHYSFVNRRMVTLSEDFKTVFCSRTYPIATETVKKENDNFILDTFGFISYEIENSNENIYKIFCNINEKYVYVDDGDNAKTYLFAGSNKELNLFQRNSFSVIPGVKVPFLSIDSGETVELAYGSIYDYEID